jgi:ankyrin repeat protein
MTKIRELIDAVDYDGLREMLAAQPALANQGIPFDDQNTAAAHPLHRICDGVFEKRYSDEAAAGMAEIFLAFGADVNGGSLVPKRDTPLIAAASLHADGCALLYIAKGADIHHRGTFGGTALHWAAWCGREKVVRRLIEEGANVNQKCMDHEATPLFWTLHGYRHGGEKNRYRQAACVRLLLAAGADKDIPSGEGTTVFDLLREEDVELRGMLG